MNFESCYMKLVVPNPIKLVDISHYNRVFVAYSFFVRCIGKQQARFCMYFERARGFLLNIS